MLELLCSWHENFVRSYISIYLFMFLWWLLLEKCFNLKCHIFSCAEPHLLTLCLIVNISCPKSQYWPGHDILCCLNRVIISIIIIIASLILLIPSYHWEWQLSITSTTTPHISSLLIYFIHTHTQFSVLLRKVINLYSFNNSKY